MHQTFKGTSMPSRGRKVGADPRGMKTLREGERACPQPEGSPSELISCCPSTTWLWKVLGDFCIPCSGLSLNHLCKAQCPGLRDHLTHSLTHSF